ncbi:MAG: RNA polymerase sigma-70 factor (ECF subfamily) [Cryomorphaceae bacterium]|jgi:RNA polymerase sigma-70 factor (ECF subfamily)
MQMVAQANHDAFTEMVWRHTDRFLGLAFQSLQNISEAEEVVQACFIKLWQNPNRWDADKSLFTTWFYRVIVNACHDSHRKAKREITLQQHAANHIVDTVDSEQNNLQQEQYERWQQHCLEIAISELPAAQRDAINLVVYSELPQKQAAQIMGISLKALESLLVRAKRSMTLSVNKMREQSGMRTMRDVGS